MKKLLLIFLLIAAWSVQAREVYPLCDDWLFSFRYENSSDNARCVTLPHTWNLDALAGTIPYLRTTADYQRKLYVPQTWTGKRLFLKFYGVESVAHLFVNGTYVGEHRGGTTAFVFEITDRVKYGSENLLRVAVSNAITGDVLPLSSIHNIYGGISREVELIVTDPTAVSPLYLGSSGVLIHPRAVSTERAEAEAEIHLTSKGDNFCRVTLEAFDPDGIQAAAKTIKAKLDGKPIVIPFTVENPRLWDLDHPNLYRMRVSVESDTSRDEIEIATGFRNIRVTPEEGFLLNDSLVRVHGVTLYYDRPGTGSAMEAEDYAEDFAFIRELGANALRSPAGPHAPCLYDLCDRTGVLVWIDLPLIRAPFLSDVSYYPNPQLEANGRQQLREIIAQHINRPSVVIWGLFDCLWQRGENPVPYVRTLNELAKKMDRSRPTAATSNQDGELNQITDLIVWAQNIGWDKGRTEDLEIWLGQLRSGWNQLRSGICYGEAGQIEQQGDPARRRRSNSLLWQPEGRQTRFHEDYTKYLAQDTLLWGTWINTLFDYGSARRPQGVEATGLVTLDRRRRKDAFHLYKALWNNTEPTLHITGRREDERNGDLQTVTVYSSAGEPVVTLSGDTLAVEQYAPCIYRCDSVRLNGRMKIEAKAGDLYDETFLTGNCALVAPPRRDPQQTAGLRLTN